MYPSLNDVCAIPQKVKDVGFYLVRTRQYSEGFEMIGRGEGGQTSVLVEEALTIKKAGLPSCKTMYLHEQLSVVTHYMVNMDWSPEVLLNNRLNKPAFPTWEIHIPP